MRPQLKPFRVDRDAGVVCLVREPGVHFELGDDSGQVHALLTRLDGSRTIPELHQSLVADWPELTEPQVAEAVKALDVAGLLVDAATTDAATGRYASNLAFLSTFASLEVPAERFHDRLRQAHVVLLGVGGLGSTMLLSLAGAGVGRLTLLDMDRVELKNLTRQFLYDESDVGQPKLERARARALAVNSSLRIDTVERQVAEPADVLPLLDGADLVVCGIDRPRDIRRIVSRACVAAEVPFLSGGMWATRGSYFGFVPGHDGCLDCWRLESMRAGADLSPVPVAETNRAMGPMAAVVSGMIGVEAIRLLTGFAPAVSLGRMWGIDFVSGEVAVFDQWSRQPDCPTCGTP